MCEQAAYLRRYPNDNTMRRYQNSNDSSSGCGRPARLGRRTAGGCEERVPVMFREEQTQNLRFTDYPVPYNCSDEVDMAIYSNMEGIDEAIGEFSQVCDERIYTYISYPYKRISPISNRRVDSCFTQRKSCTPQILRSLFV